MPPFTARLKPCPSFRVVSQQELSIVESMLWGKSAALWAKQAAEKGRIGSERRSLSG